MTSHALAVAAGVIAAAAVAGLVVGLRPVWRAGCPVGGSDAEEGEG